MIGAHVSAAGSLANSLDRAKLIGAECSQIFIGPPKRWLQVEFSPQTITDYVTKQNDLAIKPNFIHGSYLINLGTADSIHLERSIKSLIHSQTTAAKLGIQGTIFHIGSHKGLGFEQVVTQVCQSIDQILSQSPQTVQLILETSVGGGGNIGSFNELGEILRMVNKPNLKVCLDTQHIFAAGYDLTTDQGLAQTLEEFSNKVGLENLVVVHLNDSKVELAGKRDRHENIGQGFIKEGGISKVINHPHLKDLPFILEVPGIDKKGPNKDSIDMVRKLLR